MVDLVGEWCVVALALAGDGAGASPATPDDLLARTTFRELSLAPDGRRALLFEAKGNGQGELVELRFASDPADFTVERRSHPLPDDAWGHVAWDARSGRAAFLRASPPRTEVWLLDEGGEPRLALPIGVGANVFELFFRERRDGGGSELLALHNVYLGPETSRPGSREAVLSPIDLEREELDAPIWYGGVTSIKDATLSPDGSKLAFVGTIHPTFAAEGEPLYLSLCQLDGEGWQRDLTQDDTIAARPVFSPDSTRIACVLQPARTLLSTAKRDLVVLDLLNGTAQLGTADQLASIGNGVLGDEEAISFLDERTLLVATQHGLADHLLAVDLPAAGATQPEPRSRFVSFGATSWQKLRVAPAAQRLLAIESGPSLPERIVAAEWPSLQPRVVEAPNGELAARSLAHASTLAFRGADEWPMEGLLLTPPNGGEAARAAPWPTIFLLHGASSGRQTLRFNDGQAQAWATLGYAVFAPNLRGSAGYGAAFNAANERDFGGKELADLDAAVDLLVERGIADPKRLYLLGHSYGGYLVEMELARSHRFAAASAVSGVSDWQLFVESSDLAALAYIGLGATESEFAARAAERSPLQLVDRIATPLLLVHGERDRRVPIAQSERLAAALARHGVDCDLVRLAQVGHMLRGREVIAPVLRAQDAWFRGHVGPADEHNLMK